MLAVPAVSIRESAAQTLPEKGGKTALPVSPLAPGDLDPTFGSAGKVMTPIGPAQSGASSIAIQADGKIVAAGYTVTSSHSTFGQINAFALTRYDADGALDASFGAGGTVVTIVSTGYTASAGSVGIQPDGKIVVAGTAWDTVSQWGYFAIVRYNPNGSLDLTFDGDGIVLTQLGTGWVTASSVALQSDGKIIVAGSFDYYMYDFPQLAVVRYNSNGTLDLPFGEGERQTAELLDPILLDHDVEDDAGDKKCGEE